MKNENDAYGHVITKFSLMDRLPHFLSCGTRGAPWSSAIIDKRQTAFIKYAKDSPVYRLWRNRVHGAIKKAKRSYYNNKVDGWLKLTPKKCWHDIKSLTGQDTFGKREWYHQFLSDVITSPAELATQITLKCTTQEPLMPARSQPKLRPT